MFGGGEVRNGALDPADKHVRIRKKLRFVSSLSFSECYVGTIYQPLRSGKIWHKVNF